MSRSDVINVMAGDELLQYYHANFEFFKGPVSKYDSTSAVTVDFALTNKHLICLHTTFLGLKTNIDAKCLLYNIAVTEVVLTKHGSAVHIVLHNHEEFVIRSTTIFVSADFFGKVHPRGCNKMSAS